MSALEREPSYESDDLPAIGLAEDDAPAVDVSAISLAMNCARWEEALSLLRPAVTSPNAPCELRLDYAHCLLETGRAKKALRVLAISGGRTYRHFVLIARAAAQERDRQTAIRAIQDAFVLNRERTMACVHDCDELARFFDSMVIDS